MLIKLTIYKQNYFFKLQVLIPTKVYSGQKLIRLVNAKITAKTPSIIARVPEITSV